MSDSIKDAFDNASLIRDIAERENIICNYQKYSLLDREDAIKKIQKLRISGKDVADVTVVHLSVSSTPFSQATDDQIVGELAMQRNILKEKLIKKQAVENNEH